MALPLPVGAAATFERKRWRVIVSGFETDGELVVRLARRTASKRDRNTCLCLHLREAESPVRTLVVEEQRWALKVERVHKYFDVVYALHGLVERGDTKLETGSWCCCPADLRR